jgi:nucleoside-diphosphate-sugar epimerase
MRVFVTGATGFVGSAVVQELIAAGHQVLGLARSDEGANKLIAAGAEVHRGDLEDLDSLLRGAAATDGVIHTGFIHDFSRFKEVCEVDRRVIEALGKALAGTGKPFVITSGIGLLTNKGRLATENDKGADDNPNPRIASEKAADVAAELGARVSLIRLPPTVHDAGDHGFIPMIINIAREKGIAIYQEEGANRWPAVHRLDAAKLYRLALEQVATPGIRYHAVAEEGMAFKHIAEAIGKGLNIPVASKSAEEAAAHFTWFSHFAKMDCAASAQQTKESLAWEPVQPGLIADLDLGGYFKVY